MKADILNHGTEKQISRYVKLIDRYGTDELFSILVDELQRALNETHLEISDARAAVYLLQHS